MPHGVFAEYYSNPDIRTLKCFPQHLGSEIMRSRASPTLENEIRFTRDVIRLRDYILHY